MKFITDQKRTYMVFKSRSYLYSRNKCLKNEILKKNKIQIIKTNRGGKTTYHGPGQRIIYFIINLNKRKKDIRKFISIIETVTYRVFKYVST